MCAIDAQAGRTSHVRWRVLAFLIVLSFVAYALKTNMSVAGVAMMHDLGLSEVQFGIILAGSAWGYGLFQFPGGLLGDALGGRKAMALIVALWGVTTLLVGFTPAAGAFGPVALVAFLTTLRFLLGASQAPLFPITGGEVIARWFPVSGWALPNGLTNVGLTFGSAAAGPLVAWLVLATGWRQSFVVAAPVALVLAAAWYVYVRDSPAEDPTVSPSERAFIDAGRPPEPTAPPERASWRSVLRNRQVLLLTASYFCTNYVFYFFLNWGFAYLVEVRGFKQLEGGGLSSLWWLTGGIGAALGGYWGDTLSRRIGLRRGCRWPCIVGNLGSGAAMAAAALAASPYVAVGALCAGLAFQQLADPVYWAATMSVSGRHASAGCGVLNTGGNLVGGINALLVPIMAQALGWVAAIGTATAFALAAAVLWLWIEADRRPLEEVVPVTLAAS
jgi:ACS family glucarate transporter-like MFS transporter